MPQTPLDADVADFLDDSDWTPAVVANATSKLNAWCRWLAPDTGPATPLADTAGLPARAGQDAVAASTRRDDWKMIRAFYRWAATPTRHHGGGLLEERSDGRRQRPPRLPAPGDPGRQGRRGRRPRGLLRQPRPPTPRTAARWNGPAATRRSSR